MSISFFALTAQSQINNAPIYNETNTVPISGKMDQVTVSARNSKSDTRLAKMEMALRPTENQTIKERMIESISVSFNKLSGEVSKLQAKYANLLNILPSTLSNLNLLEGIDTWYGTRYLYGGTTKSGIDCSAFVRALFSSVYNIELPRTAREQYDDVRRISATELKEGDLVFFNTRGGVSHVGVYLRNNKFVHSSSSKGVTISDLYDPYYMARFISGGRIEKPDYMAKN